MKTTPTFGFQIAQGTDPAKQYPAAVDDPFKTALDTLLTPYVRDTGWRFSPAPLANGWTASSPPVVRRVGRTVHLRLPDLTVPATFNAAVFASVPAGFSAATAAYTYSPMFVVTSAAVTTTGYMALSGISWVSVAGSVPAGTRVRANLVYITDDAWPTTLPGTPTLRDQPQTQPAGTREP